MVNDRRLVILPYDQESIKSRLMTTGPACTPNIKIQRAGTRISNEFIGDFPAADLGVRRIEGKGEGIGVNSRSRAMGVR